MKQLIRAAVVAVGAIVTVPVVVSLSGCATFGVPTAETFEERIVAGYKTAEATADMVGTAFDAGKISNSEANATLDKVQAGKEGIDAAAAFRNAGDFSNAETRLAASIAALELLQSQLRAK